MDPRKIKLDEFMRHAISVSLLKEYWYCAPKILARKIVGEIETPVLLDGRKIHEEELGKIADRIVAKKAAALETVYDAMLLSSRNLLITLRKRETIANTENRKFFFAILPNGIFGVPDEADCGNGKYPVIVELKTKDQLPSRSYPWSGDELQVVAYMMGMETLGFKPEYGLLRYSLRSSPEEEKEFKITPGYELRNKVYSTAESIRLILEGKQEPIPPSIENKCRKCPRQYRDVCKHKIC